MLPIINYVGGKRRMLKHIKPILPKFEVYHEPFIGGGALFFDLEPDKAYICDSNERLIRFYTAMSRWPHTICEKLDKLSKLQDKQNYLEIRKQFNDDIDDISFAAYYIYFNKVSFGSVMRFNNSGQFNVPYWKAHGRIYTPSHIHAASKLLSHTKILCIDFAEYCRNFIGQDLTGHLFYFDPPYLGTVTAKESYYGKFTHKQMIDAATYAYTLSEHGASVIVSYNEKMENYLPGFERVKHDIKYSINSKKQTKCQELIFIKGDFHD